MKQVCDRLPRQLCSALSADIQDRVRLPWCVHEAHATQHTSALRSRLELTMARPGQPAVLSSLRVGHVQRLFGDIH